MRILTSSFSSVSRFRLATKASRLVAGKSPLGTGLERGDDPATEDVFVRPFIEGTARGDTADRAVAPLEMIDVGAFDRGGDVVAGDEDIDRRTGTRTGFAIEAVN